jgi:Cu/Ag efflux pump CusA
MIHRIVAFALSQRFLVIAVGVLLMAWGVLSFQRLPIDAYPDLSPPHVEIVAQWPGHAAEEVERLIATPDGQHLPISQFADIRVNNGASFIYREGNSRYVGVQFSVEHRDLAGARWRKRATR